MGLAAVGQIQYLQHSIISPQLLDNSANGPCRNARGTAAGRLFMMGDAGSADLAAAIAAAGRFIIVLLGA